MRHFGCQDTIHKNKELSRELILKRLFVKLFTLIAFYKTMHIILNRGELNKGKEE
jgi:hypothetical protein